MDSSKNCAVRNPSRLPADLETTNNRPNWYLFYTGGLFTTGGLGWGLRIAYAKYPKAAMLSYLTGSVGLCLFNMAVIPLSGKKSSEASGPNWSMMISGAVISGAGFGYCLSFTLKEHPKSTIIAYAIGSLGYIMTNAAVYTLCRKNEEKEKKEKREKEEEKANKKTYDSIDASHARIHYASVQCEFCKNFVEKAIRERKVAETQQGLKAIWHYLWNSIKKFFPLTGHIKEKDSLVIKKASLQDNLKRETSKTCRDENNPKKTAKRKPFRAPRPINLNKDSVEVTASPYANCKPMTVPNKFPGEKSTQMNSRLGIKGIQTHEVYLAHSNETGLEYSLAIENKLEAEAQGWSVSDFMNETQQLLEVPTEDQQLELEDKQ